MWFISGVDVINLGLSLAFAEDVFPERIEPLFHSDSDNQLLNRRDEVEKIPVRPVLWYFVFEQRRFRQFLSSLAEWCAAYWK